jgi:hypothetical protein
MEVAQHYTEYIKKAKEAEENGEPETAAAFYEKQSGKSLYWNSLITG